MIWVTARSLVDAKLGAKRFCPSRPLFLLLKYDSRWASGISLLLSLSIAHWLSSSWPNRSAALPHDWWSICKWFDVDVEGLPFPIVGLHKYVKAFFRTKAVNLQRGTVNNLDLQASTLFRMITVNGCCPANILFGILRIRKNSISYPIRGFGCKNSVKILRSKWFVNSREVFLVPDEPTRR